MKFIVVLTLVIASSSARGSGPYLPSGWRPQGPAFLLPSELENTSTAEAVIQESEASGSESLREYGPPKEDISLQGLPDAVTEQAFAVINAKFNEVNANDEEQTTSIEESVTEVVEKEVEDLTVDLVRGQSTMDEQTQVNKEAEEVSLQLLESTKKMSAVAEKSVEEKESDDNTQINVEVTKTVEKEKKEVGEAKKIVKETQEIDNANSNVLIAVEERIVEEGAVNNIAEALVNLENEIKDEQVKTEEAFLKTVQESARALENVAEGFLEYGPPGFREYGPPKEALLRTIEEEEKSVAEPLDTNETRRRRFSPKFRSTKAKKSQ